MQQNHRLIQVEDYEPLVGKETVQRVREKAQAVKHLHVTHVNSTYYGGGVATLLGSLTILMNSSGVKTGWRVMQGSPDFFNITKKLHNALQGGDVILNEEEKEIFEGIVYENAVRNHLGSHDRVVIHDPQPLPMIDHFPERGPWIWRCHVDLSDPNPHVWNYLKPFIEKFDSVILSLKEYARELQVPQLFFMPAIDPFTIKNREMSDEEINRRLDRYEIPTDLPIVTQISRFDSWKDPQGVIDAFRLASEEVDATLVLLGNIATDDPEGEQIYHSLLDCRSERIKIISAEDTVLVNALQSKSAVILQKSLREGFGLTVTEAMWKRTPVIGGNVGGIKYQIEDGVNGFLVSSVQEAARRIVDLIQNPDMGRQMGEKARESVRKNFLMIRLLEQYLDLIDAYEVVYRYKGLSG